MKCVIFDFDLTLVDSSKISDLIFEGNWGAVFRNISEVSMYSGAKEVLIELEKMGIPYAIASRSPKGYIERVLKYHQISCECIIGFHATSSEASFSKSLLKCSQYFSLEPEDCVYIGNKRAHYDSALNAGFKFIGVGWGDFEYVKVIKFSCYQEFIDTLLHIEKDNAVEFGSDLLVNHSNHYCLGFYNGSIRDKIIEFKSGNDKSLKRWSSLAKKCGEYLPKIDVVVRALGHDELSSKKNSLCSLSETIADSVGASYLPNLLKKSKKTLKSTGLSKYQRINQISGIYYAQERVLGDSNLSFLIVDDVYTTGATTREITRAIHHSYPSANVYVFTLVKTLLFADSHLAFHHNKRLYQLYNTFIEYNDTAKKRAKVEKVSKLFSANYTNTNHNFIIQNLPESSLSSIYYGSIYLPAIQILKNIIQRGKPTLCSKFLRSALSIENFENFSSVENALIDTKRLSWQRVIKGDTVSGFNPAQKFFDELIDKYLGEFKFIRNLILPEVRIFDITQVYVEALYNQFVDFYLPQASLIIEIDGEQHKLSKDIDYIREAHANKYGVTTLRITSNEISNESKSFKEKMAWIVNFLNKEITSSQGGRVFTLSDYKQAYNNKNYQATNYLATAVIRFQLTILELIESGRLTFDKEWLFEIKTRDTSKFAELAIEDTLLWLRHLYSLQNIEFEPVKYKVSYIEEDDVFSNEENTKIDFSLFQRHTDEHQLNPDVIFVRTSYLEQYKYYSTEHSAKTRSVEYKNYDYFKISTSLPIKYNLRFGQGSNHYDNLIFILQNVFLYNLTDVTFREGQLGIIAAALMRDDTIGLLPTGSGKSICYQLAAILQPAISFVVCPIKSLMYDQKADLDAVGFTRTSYITSDLDAEEKEAVQSSFSQGKYFFIYISPERFQSQKFRLELQKLNSFSTFAYAVIDEVHCLSEWGHDFRISYLNLANAIEKFAPDSTYIGLTATASVNVLRDIQSEFNISDVNVKTPINFTRKELRFSIIDDRGKKEEILGDLIANLKAKWHEEDLSQKKCGIIFTPHVNGRKGCHPLSGSLSSSLGENVHYYSGSVPKSMGTPLMSDFEFDKYKKGVQEGFKSNEYHLLTATKAFGMGINKGNIAFTVHYGMPSSMEALYQEAGRAGRNKQLFAEEQADCIVLISPEHYTHLDEIWGPDVSVEQLRSHQKCLSRDSDISTNLFMFLNGIDTVNDDFSLIKRVYDTYYQKDGELLKKITSLDVDAGKGKVQKAIYRLLQLGIVSDWTVEDFFSGVYEVQFVEHDAEVVKKSLENTVHKYAPDFSISGIIDKPEGRYQTLVNMRKNNRFSDIEFYISVLLLWSYEHFAYNRRQSLKNVYEQCLSLTTGELSNEEFKIRLENYFRFNESSHFLQHIADNPHEISHWFDIFYDDTVNEDNKELLPTPKLIPIKDQLSRFLESYMNNTGLNFISGLIRLLTGDFLDPDGRNRLVAAFRNIKDYEDDKKALVIEGVIELVSNRVSMKDKNEVVMVIHEALNQSEILEQLNNQLEDEFSTGILLEKQLNKMRFVTSNMKDMKWLMH